MRAASLDACDREGAGTVPNSPRHVLRHERQDAAQAAPPRPQKRLREERSYGEREAIGLLPGRAQARQKRVELGAVEPRAAEAREPFRRARREREPEDSVHELRPEPND